MDIKDLLNRVKFVLSGSKEGYLIAQFGRGENQRIFLSSYKDTTIGFYLDEIVDVLNWFYE